MSSTRVTADKPKSSRASSGAPNPNLKSGGAKAADRAAPPERKPVGSGAPRSVAVVDAPAPGFALLSDNGDQVALDDYRGKWVVLFFYPKDNTPGCTREALAFQAASARLGARDAVVLGVSRDSVTSHVGFKQKQGLKFPLLSDPVADTHKLYGAFGEKMMYGKKVVGAIRTTVLIRPDGTVAKIFSPVKVDGHADAVLAAIEQAPG